MPSRPADPRERPIGVFDSGVGGLTVLHELLVRLPHEDYVYLADRARFVVGNLFEATTESVAGLGPLDKALIDPPREGAFAIAKALADLCDADRPAAPGVSWQAPQRIVYVSCNPATLARDAGLLVHRAGYRCTAAGVVNMFPHTAHVESIAVFDRAEAAAP